jgi:hypothetical protein
VEKGGSKIAFVSHGRAQQEGGGDVKGERGGHCQNCTQEPFEKRKYMLRMELENVGKELSIKACQIDMKIFSTNSTPSTCAVSCTFFSFPLSRPM